MKAAKSKKIKVLVVMGTRPEVIKLAPVIHALRTYSEKEKAQKRKNKKLKSGRTFETLVCLTGQHLEMVEPFLKVFGLKPDYDLQVMEPNQHLAEVTSKVLLGMKKILSVEKPGWVLVQGDTTSALAAALAAFYSRVKVGHVEAGLRTEDRFNPFLEEINRRLITHLADLHFAPTRQARENLLREGIRRERILVTGNTVVDALKMILRKAKGKWWFKNLRLIKEDIDGQNFHKDKLKSALKTRRRKDGKIEFQDGSRTEKTSGSGFSGKRNDHQEQEVEKIKKLKEALFSEGTRSQGRKKLILVTAHRRESFGKGMEEICRAILRIVDKVKEVEVVFPVHLNPNVRRVVLRYLAGRERIYLVEPVDYFTFVQLMRRASLILTDSGGIQEEAPSLGVPVVVMREKTERPEAVEAGVAWIGGTRAERIEKLARQLLKKVEDNDFRRRLRRGNPFGDGRASRRILRALS